MSLLTRVEKSKHELEAAGVKASRLYLTEADTDALRRRLAEDPSILGLVPNVLGGHLLGLEIVEDNASEFKVE